MSNEPATLEKLGELKPNCQSRFHLVAGLVILWFHISSDNTKGRTPCFAADRLVGSKSWSFWLPTGYDHLKDERSLRVKESRRRSVRFTNHFFPSFNGNVLLF